MIEARRAMALGAVGGTPQFGVTRVDRFDVHEQHGGAPLIGCGDKRR
jgi:hypothetical protein